MFPLTKRNVLITGGTGFIGRRLVRRLIKQDPGLELSLLVEPRLRGAADAEISKLKAENLTLSSMIIEGDITAACFGLGTASYDQLCGRVTDVIHLAALYDLAVPQRIAEKVNIDGTQHVIDFLRDAGYRPTLHYFSTCYVSGRRVGVVREADLDCSFGFKNFYESTKFEAERRVRGECGKGLKAIIIRPGIVCGDSRTGETEKFDGIYFSMALVAKLHWLPFRLPRPGRLLSPVNLVPVDFVEAAFLVLWEKAGTLLGKTFQFADPNPLTAGEVYDRTCRLIMHKPAGIFTPAFLFNSLLLIPFIRRWFGVPREMMAYFNHGASYDSTELQKALAGSGVECPRLGDYLETLYRYWAKKSGSPP